MTPISVDGSVVAGAGLSGIGASWCAIHDDDVPTCPVPQRRIFSSRGAGPTRRTRAMRPRPVWGLIREGAAILPLRQRVANLRLRRAFIFMQRSADRILTTHTGS